MSKKDKWGQTVLSIDCEFRENERKMQVDMMDDAVEILETAGMKDVKALFDNGSFPGMAIHEMGTARMGNDPKTSVLNKWNQMHEVKNVFVTDGSCMTSSACQNIPAKESPRRLARLSEAQDSPISKALLWKALGDVKDPQLYKADISVVDLGLIYDISVRGGVVKITMAMPHRSRPLGTYFTYGSNVVHATVSKNITEALYEVPGVQKVIMEQTWYPGWSSNLLTDVGRRKLNL